MAAIAQTRSTSSTTCLLCKSLSMAMTLLCGKPSKIQSLLRNVSLLAIYLHALGGHEFGPCRSLSYLRKPNSTAEHQVLAGEGSKVLSIVSSFAARSALSSNMNLCLGSCSMALSIVAGSTNGIQNPPRSASISLQIGRAHV